MACHVKSSLEMLHSLFQLLFRSFLILEAFNTWRLYPTVSSSVVKLNDWYRLLRILSTSLILRNSRSFSCFLNQVQINNSSCCYKPETIWHAKQLSNKTTLDLLHPCNTKSQQCQESDCSVHAEPNKLKSNDLFRAQNFKGNVIYQMFTIDLNSTWQSVTYQN